jgi:hypothetical protein
MSQFHQLFVIARIQDRYRSLAVVHHPWLFGSRAVDTCVRLIRIFNEPANRYLLDLDLARATRIPQDVFTKELSYKDLAEFPFITQCLMMDSAIGFKTGFTSNAHALP